MFDGIIWNQIKWLINYKYLAITTNSPVPREMSTTIGWIVWYQAVYVFTYSGRVSIV